MEVLSNTPAIWLKALSMCQSLPSRRSLCHGGPAPAPACCCMMCILDSCQTAVFLSLPWIRVLELVLEFLCCRMFEDSQKSEEPSQAHLLLLVIVLLCMSHRCRTCLLVLFCKPDLVAFGGSAEVYKRMISMSHGQQYCDSARKCCFGHHRCSCTTSCRRFWCWRDRCIMLHWP